MTDKEPSETPETDTTLRNHGEFHVIQLCRDLERRLIESQRECENKQEEIEAAYSCVSGATEELAALRQQLEECRNEELIPDLDSIANIDTGETWKQLIEDRAALRQRLESAENALIKRARWLMKEANSGGDWEHLKTRFDECSYLLQKLFPGQGVDAPLAQEGK